MKRGHPTFSSLAAPHLTISARIPENIVSAGRCARAQVGIRRRSFSGRWCLSGSAGLWRTAHTNLSICHNDKTATPSLNIVHSKYCLDSVCESASAWITQAQNHQSVMAPGCITTDIGEIEVLCDKKPLRLLSGVPHGLIVQASQSFLGHGVRIVSEVAEDADQVNGEIFIQFDVHEMSGTL